MLLYFQKKQNLVYPENKATFYKLEDFEKKKFSTQLHREFNQTYISDLCEIKKKYEKMNAFVNNDLSNLQSSRPIMNCRNYRNFCK